MRESLTLSLRDRDGIVVVDAVGLDPEGIASATEIHVSGCHERYLQPWEFRRSREEAIYEMHDAARRGWLRRLLRSLRDFRRSRREFFRWQIMIFGKTGDEQLWDVRYIALAARKTHNVKCLPLAWH